MTSFIGIFSMQNIALCVLAWCEVRNFASQKFRLTPSPKEKRRILPESTPAFRIRSHLC